MRISGHLYTFASLEATAGRGQFQKKVIRAASAIRLRRLIQTEKPVAMAVMAGTSKA